MANSQHVGGKHRHGRQRRSSSPSRDDWERRLLDAPPLESLPHRPQKRDIEVPNGRKHKMPSSRRHRRASEDMRVATTSQGLTRSATVSHWNGRDPLAYGVDEDRKGRSRVRSRSASRSGNHISDSESASGSATPQSALVNQSTPESRRSSRRSSSRRTPSIESASSISTRGGGKKQGNLKEKNRVIPVPDAPPAIAPEQHRRKRREKEHVYEVDSENKTRHGEPAGGNSSPARHSHRPMRNQLDSRSGYLRRHRHREHWHETKPSSSSKRRSSKKYYESDSVGPEKPSPPRSYATSGSHVTSQTVSSTSKRSSIMSSLFGSSVQSHRSDKRAKMAICLICMEEMTSSKTAKLNCGHRMCNHCLKRSFRLSVKDPIHMPPKCCGEDHIPLKHVERLFDLSFKKTWNQKFTEYTTRNRIYCPSRGCGQWIKPNHVKKTSEGRKQAKCTHCGTVVCVSCNGKWHKFKDCPQDKETNEILEQAKEHGWQRCFNCRMLVELKEGCNHMTCVCGAEFCMICGVKWKSCDCPWFNYDAVEQDRLDHVQIPTNGRQDQDRLGSRETPRDTWGTAQSGHGLWPRPQNYEEELILRRFQEQRDEDLARRLQYDDHEDDYAGVIGEVIGIGNTAGHFMNNDYRRVPQALNVPPIPQPLPMPAPFERANTTDNYVAGVNRARGVPRAASMERRLADRFSEQRQGTSPTHNRGPYLPIPPPPAPPMMIPVPVPVPPAPLPRRHTMQEVHNGPVVRRAERLSERFGQRRVRSDHDVDGPNDSSARRWHREHERVEPPKDSALAGLNGLGRGMNRVFEWMNYVRPGDPDTQTVAS